MTDYDAANSTNKLPPQYLQFALSLDVSSHCHGTERKLGLRLPSQIPLHIQPLHGWSVRIMQLQYLLLVTAAVTWPGALQRNIFSQIHTNSAEPCPAQTHRSLQLLDRAELS